MPNAYQMSQNNVIYGNHFGPEGKKSRLHKSFKFGLLCCSCLDKYSMQSNYMVVLCKDVCVAGTISSHISGGHGDEAHNSRGVLHIEPRP